MKIDAEKVEQYVRDGLFDQFPNSPISRLLLDHGMGQPGDEEGPSQQKIEDNLTVKEVIKTLASAITSVINGPSPEDQINDILNCIYSRSGHDFNVKVEGIGVSARSDEPGVLIFSYVVPEDADFVNCLERHSQRSSQYDHVVMIDDKKYYADEDCMESPERGSTAGPIPVQDDRGHRRLVKLTPSDDC